MQTCIIPKHDFQKFFISAYCLTTHMAQGRTFDQHYVIHEKDKMDRQLLYTAVSRSRHSDYVCFSDVKIPSFASDPLIRKNIKLSLSWITGCTFNQLLEYMTPLLPGRYGWEDYGWDWEMDHIKDKDYCKKNDIPQDQMDHYTNLRPVEISRNRSRQNGYDDAQRV